MTDNQYFCERCQSKQDAKRSVILDTLPPVIQFQLLRFVWDLKTGTKKKVKGIIQFTSTLNMAKFVGTPAQRESEEAQEEKDEMIYELTAVLMHKGLSAYSGHYIAQIWDHEYVVHLLSTHTLHASYSFLGGRNGSILTTKLPQLLVKSLLFILVKAKTKTTRTSLIKHPPPRRSPPKNLRRPERSPKGMNLSPKALFLNQTHSLAPAMPIC